MADVDLSLDAGEVVAVMGSSGAGKSTLLMCLAGVLAPDAGEVWAVGQRMDVLSDRERSRLRLSTFGFVFQFGDLLAELSIQENVALPLRLGGVTHTEAHHRAREMLDRLGLGELAARRPSQVSGGELQRAAVGRALVHRPAVVFADEPTGAVDERNRAEVLAVLLELARVNGTAVVLVTHDRAVAEVADRVLTLRDGHLEKHR